MDLEQQQQQHTSLFGTPPPPLPVPSVPMKEPPGYEEAMKQQPKAQVRAVLLVPLESRCKVAVGKPFRFPIRASKREWSPNCPFLSLPVQIPSGGLGEDPNAPVEIPTAPCLARKAVAACAFLPSNSLGLRRCPVPCLWELLVQQQPHPWCLGR